jgi:hypothetical protein
MLAPPMASDFMGPLRKNEAPRRQAHRIRDHMFAMGLETPEFIALITALVVGLTVHEFAHAWSAYQLGDDTAYLQGRLTLDPRSHIDPIGALMMFVAGFGWARPVPINPYTRRQHHLGLQLDVHLSEPSPGRFQHDAHRAIGWLEGAPGPRAAVNGLPTSGIRALRDAGAAAPDFRRSLDPGGQPEHFLDGSGHPGPDPSVAFCRRILIRAMLVTGDAI